MESRTRKIAIGLLSSLLALLIIAAGLTIYFMYSRIEYLSDNPWKAFETAGCAPKQLPDFGGDDIGPSPTGPSIGMPPEVMNILLVGIDTDEERETEYRGYRNDMNVVLSIDFTNKTAKILTIPRDTRTLITKLDKNGKVVKKVYNRINTAVGSGGGPDKFGYENTMYCISKFLSCNGKYDIPINYYVGLNMDGLVPLADAVGGVPVTLEADFPQVGKKGETVILTGEKVHFYVRWRKPSQTGESSGDIGRGRRQQLFMLGLAKQIKKMGPMAALPALFNTLNKYMDTNLSLDQIAAFALVLQGLDLDSIELGSVAGRPKSFDGASMWDADPEKLDEQVWEMFIED
ncbi:MAG: LCP family protein [Bacillota bacterium]|nr:LCP family protein [Bacillota bacterium]